MDSRAIWEALRKSHAFIAESPLWVSKLVKGEYAEALDNPALEQPLREDCVYRPTFEVKIIDGSYLRFLEEQIRLNARGEAWTRVLQKRLAALRPYLRHELYYVGLHHMALGTLESCRIVLDPRNLRVVHWETG